ncbi:protein kinase [Mycobacterium sp. ACS1612]|uniref:protein kinase domain-containing protein n=1 Tax=Mycobacterium sp. ACS1612 TaxID=1834117 RepID=UPI001E54C5BE|nr:protein kinase [Mycobacterium sp. ACS1612]
MVKGTSFSHYLLQELLGRGGMGEVWRAHDTVADRIVAVKVLPPQWAQDEVFRQRFRREAQAAARLHEPHVVPIHSFGEIDGRLYVEMRLIEGRDLHALLAEGPLIPPRAVAIIEQVAHALDAVHQSGLIHRDVKPSNILITRYDFAYLIDFGIARAAQETGLTSSGHFVGTMHYMAPERFRDGDADGRVDVYALACVLQECLTAKRPFAGDGVEQQVMAHLATPPPQPSTTNPGVPTEFDAVIAKGMAKDPAERYQTPLELAEAARAVLSSANAAASCEEPAPTRPATLVGSETGSEGHAPLPEEASLSVDTTRLAPGKDPVRPSSEPVSAGASIDDLLDRAVAAINSDDRVVATALADQVLAVDDGNADAEDLLSVPTDGGQIRRLTILSTDLADSTALSMRVDAETYRVLVARYHDLVLQVADRFGGHVNSAKGDGLLVVFGYPNAHEDDVRRAVETGLEIMREVSRLSEQASRRFKSQIDIRIGVHRGLVYLDKAHDDVYGLAANLATRMSALAPPGVVLVSDSVERLIRRAFEVEPFDAVPLQTVDGAVRPYRVVCERIEPPGASLGPLIARDRELARLHKSWSRAQAGTLTTPGLVFRGEAGIGKSRLAAAATALVKGGGGKVLELAGSPLHPDAGLHPVRSLFEFRCGINRHTEPAQRLRLLHAELTAQRVDSAAVPLLAPVLGIAPEHGYRPMPAEGRKLQELIAQAVQRYLLACFGGESGLILAEDVHWFDSSSLELLDALLHGTEGRLLVVITGRSGTWLSDGWPVKVFDLAPLSDEHSDELVRALDPTVTPEECASVRERCDGVPFYIEQVVSGLRVPADAQRPPVPDPLYEPLFARLLATPDAGPVVQAAAVIGRHVDRGLLQAASALSADEVDVVVDELEDARVLEPQGTDAWRFRHELLREVAAELAPPSVRRELHARVADALVEGAVGDPDWRLVATHYEQAERHADAASAYQRASTSARRRGALDEARNYLTRAITQLGSAPAGRDRDRREIAPRLERGFLAAAAEGYQSPAVVEEFERCLQLAGTDLRDDQLFATLLALCSYYIPRADLSRAAQLLGVLQASAAEERQWFAPAIECGLGMVAFHRGEFAVARGNFEKAVAGVAEDDEHRMEALWFIPEDPVVVGHEHLALIHTLHGDLALAEADLTNAYRHAEQLGFPQGPYNHATVTDFEIEMRCWQGQFETARQLIADLLERAERYGFDFWQMYGATEQCLIDSYELMATEQADEAALSAQIDATAGCIDFWRSVGFYAYGTRHDGILGQLMITAGQRDQARVRVDAALQIAEGTGMHVYDAELLRVRARTYPDPELRATDLAAAMALARRQDAPLFELRAALDDFDLRGAAARALLIAATEHMAGDSALPELARARTALSPS